MNTLKIASEIMGIGMAGIFSAMIIIMIVTYLLKKMDILTYRKSDRVK